MPSCLLQEFLYRHDTWIRWQLGLGHLQQLQSSKPWDQPRFFFPLVILSLSGWCKGRLPVKNKWPCSTKCLLPKLLMTFALWKTKFEAKTQMTILKLTKPQDHYQSTRRGQYSRDAAAWDHATINRLAGYINCRHQKGRWHQVFLHGLSETEWCDQEGWLPPAMNRRFFFDFSSLQQPLRQGFNWNHQSITCFKPWCCALVKWSLVFWGL